MYAEEGKKPPCLWGKAMMQITKRFQVFIKAFVLMSLISSVNASTNIEKLYVNPTGIYELTPPPKYIKTSKGKVIGFDGYSGNIKAKLISKGSVHVEFDVNKGLSSYNSGSFISTLNYKNNTAIYEPHDDDPSCKIKMVFTKKYVLVEEKTDDYNFGCGFGHAVIADGKYVRKQQK